jgi:phage/plasmid-associated DNA primase
MNGAHTEEVAILETKRVSVISETDGSMKLDEAAFKAFTGSSRLPMRSLYGAQRLGTVEATIFVATNEAPTIDKMDDAISRRLVIIPSGPPLAAVEKDIHLARKILASEAEGVLASLVNGAVEWHSRSNGVGTSDGSSDIAVFDRYLSAAVAVETAVFAYENDPIIEFVDEMLDFGDSYRVSAAAVDAAYSNFRRSAHRVGKRKLYERLLSICEDRGAAVTKTARDFDGMRLRVVETRLPFEL